MVVAWLTPKTRRWRQYSSEISVNFTELHGITSQKIELFIVTSLKASNPILLKILTEFPTRLLVQACMHEGKNWIYSHSILNLYKCIKIKLNRTHFQISFRTIKTLNVFILSLPRARDTNDPSTMDSMTGQACRSQQRRL
jgi:hypothetical protein